MRPVLLFAGLFSGSLPQPWEARPNVLRLGGCLRARRGDDFVVRTQIASGHPLRTRCVSRQNRDRTPNPMGRAGLKRRE